MKTFSICKSVAAALFLCATSLHATASLVGTSVTGMLSYQGDPSNYFDPAYGFVPTTGYLNTAAPTVNISATTAEFGYNDGGNLDTADFSADSLTISDLAEVVAGPNTGFQMTFTDSAFLGGKFTLVGDDLGVTYSLLGDTLSISYPGGVVIQGQTLSSVLNFTPSPEPSTLGLIFISGLVAAATIRKPTRL